MSLRKSKFDIIGRDIDRLDVDPYNKSAGRWWWSFYDDWDDDWYDYYWDGCDVEWKYIKVPEFDWGYKVIKKSFRKWSLDEPILTGSYIDMETVYGKAEMRNRKIDILLGLVTPSYQTGVTLGDFFNRIDKNSN